MPLGAARRQGSSGEFINHFTGIRIRVRGTGTLLLTAFGQDDVTSTTLPSMTMTANNRFSILSLANVIEQRVSLEGKTSVINETFTIHRIIVFSKPMWTSLPA